MTERWHRVLAPGAAAGLALTAGALYPLTAYVVHPLALPIAAGLAAAAAISVSRPEIGVALALVLTSLTEDVAGPRPWTIGAVWTAVLLGVTFLRMLDPAGIPARLPPLALPVLAVLVVDISGIALSGDPASAAPFVRATATGIALFVVIATQLRTAAQFRWVLGGAVAAAGLAGFQAAAEHLGGGAGSAGFYTSSGQLIARVSGGFFHPNQLAGFLIVLVPLLVAAFVLIPRWRLLTTAAGALVAIGIYGSFSRAALLAIAVAPMLLVRPRLLPLLVPLLVLLVAFAMPDLLQERFATLTSSGSEAASRVDFWTTSKEIFADHPVVGVGVGQFPQAYAAARVPGKQYLPTTVFEPPPHAHNLYLHLLVEQGVVGLAAFASVIGLALRHAARLRRSAERATRWVGKAALAATAVFLVHNLFDVTLFEATAVHFWAVLGLLSAGVLLAEAEAEVGPGRRVDLPARV